MCKADAIERGGRKGENNIKKGGTHEVLLRESNGGALTKDLKMQEAGGALVSRGIWCGVRGGVP